MWATPPSSLTTFASSRCISWWTRSTRLRSADRVAKRMRPARHSQDGMFAARDPSSSVMTRVPPRKGPSSQVRTAAKSGQSPAAVAPLVQQGWPLYRWGEFAQTWDTLVADVRALQGADPDNYRSHPKTRFLAGLRQIVLNEIPSNPSDDRYQLGKTLGADAKYWRRAKWHQRFRVFFRYRSDPKLIVYVWFNDDSTLRQIGAKTDVYVVFRAMLERGKPPSTWEDLVAACRAWPSNQPPL